MLNTNSVASFLRSKPWCIAGFVLNTVDSTSLCTLYVRHWVIPRCTHTNILLDCSCFCVRIKVNQGGCRSTQ